MAFRGALASACVAAIANTAHATHSHVVPVASFTRTHWRHELEAIRAATVWSESALDANSAVDVSATRLSSQLSMSTVHVTVAPPQDAAARGWTVADDDCEFIDFVAMSDPRVHDGAVTLELPWVNCDLQFALARRTASGARMELGRSHTLSLGAAAADATPYDARIMFGDDVTRDMWISWTSSNGTATPFVLVGTQPGNYTMRFTGQSQTYTTADMCGSPANISSIIYFIDPGYMQNVLVSGLEPATLYYAVFGQDEALLSAETTFRTAKPAGADVPVRFVMMGDMALSPWPGALSTVDNIRARHEGSPIDVVLHTGDLGYAMGSSIQWPIWHAYIEPVSRQIPYAVAVGNHEYDHMAPCPQDPSGAPGNGWHPVWGDLGDDSNGEGGVPTHARFRAPSSGNSIFWYSFDIGSVHFVHLSSEHDWTPGSSQWSWIAADLAAVNRSLTPWIVTAQHRPMYNPEVDDSHFIGEHMVAALEPLYVQHGVKLNLAGHVHDYVRPCPMINGTCDPAGITYMTIGTAGATVHNESIFANQSSLVRSYRVEWGFGLFDVLNASAMHLSFIGNSDNTTHDEVWIYQ